MRNRIPNYNFGKCLKYMYSLNGIDTGKRGWAYSVACAMFDTGILNYNSTDDVKNIDARTKQRYSVKRSLQNHITRISAEEISVKWLSVYCDYFNCSADYLMGYIENPTYDLTDINKRTGLSVEAIEALELLKSDVENIDLFYNIELETLDFILKSIHKKQIRQKNGIGFTESILHFIGLYLCSGEIVKEKADTVRYRYDDKHFGFIKAGDSIDNHIIQNIYINYNDTKININDLEKLSVLNVNNNQHYVLNVSRLFKAHAFDGIQEKLIELSNEWEKENQKKQL